MATFKVGQKVKVIAQVPASIECYGSRIGQEAVVEALTHQTYGGALTIAFLSDGAKWAAIPEHLAPLTDPKADEFIEGLKKLAREPAPIVPQSEVI